MNTHQSNTLVSANPIVKAGQNILNVVSLSLALLGAAALSSSSAVYADAAVKSELTQPIDQQQGSLIIYREKGLSANSLMYYRIAVDGVPIGKLKRNTAFHLRLDAGQHVLEINDSERSTMVFTVKKNQTSYISGTIDQHWKIALKETQPTADLAARLDNCEAGFKHNCVANIDSCCAAATKSNRLVSR